MILDKIRNIPGKIMGLFANAGSWLVKSGAALERLEDNLRSYRTALAVGDTVTLSQRLTHAAGKKRLLDLEGPDTMT